MKPVSECRGYKYFYQSTLLKENPYEYYSPISYKSLHGLVQMFLLQSKFYGGKIHTFIPYLHTFIPS